MKKSSKANLSGAKPKAQAASRSSTNNHATKKSKAEDNDETIAKFLYVFGAPDGGKPRGARFLTSQHSQIVDAVNELKLAMCSDTSPRLSELGQKLPQGRVYARGKAFIPFIKKELLDQLRDAQYGPMTAQAGEEIPKEQVILPDGPMTWDEVAVGHIVIGHDSYLDGWWEAEIVERVHDQVTLKWCDYPDEGLAKRHITAVALRHPGPIKSPF